MIYKSYEKFNNTLLFIGHEVDMLVLFANSLTLFSLVREYCFSGLLVLERQCLQKLLQPKLGQTSSTYRCQSTVIISPSLRLVFLFHFTLLLTRYCSCFCIQWFGEGEKYVKAVFTLANKIAPTVVFVDEVGVFSSFCFYFFFRFFS